MVTLPSATLIPMERLPALGTRASLLISANFVYGKSARIQLTTEIIPEGAPIRERADAYLIKGISSHFAKSLAQRANGEMIPATMTLREAVARVGADMRKEVMRM